MADQSAFDKNRIEASAMAETSGLLEQLNLPPAMIAFMRKNQRLLWVLFILLVSVVTAVALYGSWRTYQINKASSALDAAMLAPEDKVAEQLKQVVAQYGSTPSAEWARVELAKIAAEKKDYDGALAELQTVNSRIASDNPLKPLVLNSMAGLQEKKQDYSAALALYEQLEKISGFENDALYAMGRVYTLMGKKQEAVMKYQEFLAQIDREESGVMARQDSRKQLVQHLINQLR